MTADTKSIDITPNQDGGVLKEILRASSETEQPMNGDTVFVHYVGTLLDGTKFDSSRDRGEKFSFEVGKGNVIKGWDMGVPTMRRGELARFTIRSEYAYGESGSPPTIPPNATLVFEIELFEFHGEDLSEAKDKSIVRRVITKGSGYAMPNDGSRVVVNLKGVETVSGRVFDERQNLEFEIGENTTNDGKALNLCPGAEQALLKFKQGEKSKIHIKSSQAWGSQGFAEFGLAPHTDVTYEIELVNFEKAKDSWQLNGDEKLEQSELMKNKGTEKFKKGEFALALKKYSKIIDYLEHEVYDKDDQKEKSKQLQLAARLNIAACHLKLKNYRQCIDACGKALELDPRNEKSLFRMAQAYQGECEFDDAIRHFNQVLEINPDNKEATHSISVCRQKIKEYSQKEKALYGKMFASLSK